MGAPAIVLAPRVVRIPTFGDYVNSFAFLADDGSVTLVDTGLKRAPKKIVAGLAAIGKHPRDVTRIVLTHAHLDRAGGARRMVDVTGLDGITVHESDAEYVRAGTPPPRDLTVTGGQFFARLPGGGFESASVAATLHDGDVIDVAGGVRVIHTPGHTPGHVSLLHESTGVLITGDALFNVLSVRWPIGALCTSVRVNQQSAHVFGELNYSVAAFTHGPEIRDRARETIRDFLRRQAT